MKNKKNPQKIALFLLYICTLFFILIKYVLAEQICNQENCQKIELKSWKDLRDHNIIKQNLDFSCGGASIATILNYFYGYKITEAQILSDMNKKDLLANFDDMQQVVEKYGFKGVALAMNMEGLKKLKIPVIVYLKSENQEHFSVLQGIDDNHVQLADPSLGKRILHILKPFQDAGFSKEAEMVWNLKANSFFRFSA